MPDINTTIKEDGIKTVLEHASRLAAPAEPPVSMTGKPVVVIPQGWQASPLPWRARKPESVSARVVVHDGPSFVQYVNRFKLPQTTIFANILAKEPVLVAVIDYHKSPGDLGAEWCEHIVEYKPRQTEAFARWTAAHNKPMSQVEFALFVENALPQCFQPAGADLLEMINAFDVEGEIRFSRAQRLQDGTVKFAFSNEQTAKAGGIALPQVFEVTMGVFEGETPVFFKVRLRYRLSGAGELKLWFEIIDLQQIVRAALRDQLNAIASSTSIVPLLGEAPSPKP